MQWMAYSGLLLEIAWDAVDGLQWSVVPHCALSDTPRCVAVPAFIPVGPNNGRLLRVLPGPVCPCKEGSSYSLSQDTGMVMCTVAVDFWSAPGILFPRYFPYLGGVPLSATWGGARWENNSNNFTLVL